MSSRGYDALCDLVMETFWSVFPYLSRSTRFAGLEPEGQQKLATVYGIGLTYLFAHEVEPDMLPVLEQTPNSTAFASLAEYCRPFWEQWDQLESSGNVRRQDPVAVWVVQVMLGAADASAQFEINALCHYYEIGLDYLKKRWRNEPLVEDPRDWKTRQREWEGLLSTCPSGLEAVSELPLGLYLLQQNDRTVMLADAKVLAIFQENGVFISGWSHPTIFAAARPDPVMGLPAEFAHPIPTEQARDWASQYADRLACDYLVETRQGELVVFLGLSHLRSADEGPDREVTLGRVKSLLEETAGLARQPSMERAALADALLQGSYDLARHGLADLPNSDLEKELLEASSVLRELSEKARPNSQLVTISVPLVSEGLADEVESTLNRLAETLS